MLLLLTIICTLCACGSSQPNVDEEELNTAITLEESDDTNLITREEKLYPFEAGYSVRRVTQSDSVLVVGGTNGNGEISLAFAPYSFSEAHGISLNQFELTLHDQPEDFKELEIYGLAGCGDGFLLLTGEAPPVRLNTRTYTMEENNPDFTGRYCITRYDSKGNPQDSQTLEILFQSGTTLSGLLPWKDSLVLYGPSGWVLIRESGETQFTELEDIQITTIQCYDSNLVALGYSYSVESNGPCALRIEADGGYEVLDFPEQNVCACQDSEGKLLFNDGTGFYTWDVGQNTIHRIMDWSGADSVQTLCRLGGSVFACVTKNSDALTLLWGEHTNESEKNTVHVLIDEGHSSLAVKLAKQNESGSLFHYEYYTADLTLSEERTRLLAEIAAGEGPDLILYNASDLDGIGLDTSSNAFETLYPYIDADETLDREAFLPGLLPALEVKGELHEIWMQTMIVTLAARTGDVGNSSAITAEDLIRLFNQNRNYTYMVDSQTSVSMLNYLANACVKQYVDVETGTCHFDDPSFRALLSWCKTLPSRTNDIDYTASDCMLNMEQVNLIRLSGAEISYYLEPYTYLGFPTGDGQGHYYTCSGNMSYRAAIPANSRNKEGAWAFISAQLTVENQLADTKPYYNLPVIMEALDRAAHGPIGFADTTLTEEQLEQLYSLITSTNKAHTVGDEQLVSIITDAAAAYFNGEKSIEETIGLIQSRANIYAAEKYGW